MSITDLFFDSAYSVISLFVIAILSGIFGTAIYKQNWRWAMWSGVFLVCFGLVLFVMKIDKFKFRKPPPRPAPEIKASNVTVEIGNTLDSSQPLETRFILNNANPAEIRNVRADTDMWDARYAGPLFHEEASALIPQLGPHGKQTIDARFLAGGVHYLKFPDAIMLQLTITYSYEGSERTVYPRFTAERDAAGKYVWFHAGEGKGMVLPDELPNTVKPIPAPAPGELQKRAKFNVIKISVEKPIEIKQPQRIIRIVLRNVGGRTAENVLSYYQTMFVKRAPRADQVVVPTLQDPQRKNTIPSSDLLFVNVDISKLEDWRVLLLKQGTYKLYVSGKITYDTVPNHYVTNYCYVYVPETADFKQCPMGGNSAT